MRLLVLVPFVVMTALVSAADPQSSTEDLPAGYVSEAPLPAGFPPPSEVGKVVEKSYPVVRSFSAKGEGAFMKCFGYLAKHKHKMTAPVVMDSRAGDDALDEDMPFGVERMHFLLEQNSLDEPKEEGPVTVADIPAMRVLSVAHQGQLEPQTLERSRKQLEDELEQRADLRAAGELRVLGYNGPMTPPAKLYWEIQLPVAPAEKH